MPQKEDGLPKKYCAKAKNSIFFRKEYPAHVPNITALHHAQFDEYGSPFTMVTIGGAESPRSERRHFKGRGDKG